MKISAIVLTKNSEHEIERCLSSLDWCSEVIVIDDFSSDDTVGIAKRKGAAVCQRRLDNDFAAQRNFGLSKAANEWVLFIDSDEVVTSRLATEIQHAMKTSQNGFYLKRKDYVLGTWLKHGETSKVELLRLARKSKGTWTRPIHEVWKVKGSVGEISQTLLHYPHPNVAQFLDKIDRYSTINARFLHKKHVRVLGWQIVAYPVGKFLLNYVLYLGFLDGTAGIIIALMMSFHSFLTRAKLYFLLHGHEKK